GARFQDGGIRQIQKLFGFGIMRCAFSFFASAEFKRRLGSFQIADFNKRNCSGIRPKMKYQFLNLIAYGYNLYFADVPNSAHQITDINKRRKFNYNVVRNTEQIFLNLEQVR